jgi:hypothetical protein
MKLVFQFNTILVADVSDEPSLKMSTRVFKHFGKIFVIYDSVRNLMLVQHRFKRLTFKRLK